MLNSKGQLLSKLKRLLNTAQAGKRNKKLLIVITFEEEPRRAEDERDVHLFTLGEFVSYSVHFQ